MSSKLKTHLLYGVHATECTSCVCSPGSCICSWVISSHLHWLRWAMLILGPVIFPTLTFGKQLLKRKYLPCSLIHSCLFFTTEKRINKRRFIFQISRGNGESGAENSCIIEHLALWRSQIGQRCNDHSHSLRILWRPLAKRGGLSIGSTSNIVLFSWVFCEVFLWL